MDKDNFRFMNRYVIAPFLACKSCLTCATVPELAYATGNVPASDGKFCNLSLDVKIGMVLELREECRSFQTEEPIERDSTYPGSTFAPHDNNHDNLLQDSTDIYFDPHAPKRCINQRQPIVPVNRRNEWDACLKLLFDRKREVPTPHITRTLELLNNSFIPQYTFRLGLPPQRGMGFDRGLWFYRSEKFNSQPVVPEDKDIQKEKDPKKLEALIKVKQAAEKNLQLKSEMKKLIMVYLYHVWFKKLQDNQKVGIYMALDASNNYSLGKDLSWWMLKVFKDETALTVYPPEDELEIEFIPISLLDKAQEAAMLAHADCNSMADLELEALEFDKMVERYGYHVTEDGVEDKDGHEILY